MARPPPPEESAQNSRNAYIPSFIAAKPFYVDQSDEDYLEHQRLQSTPKDTLDKAKWYDRGRKQGPASTKFRKGACENCGAMTHKTKECLSRPRKQGAKWTGRDIQADEVVEDFKLGWDAKRDRWNGYDAREYSAVVKEYEELEALKRSTKGKSDPQEQLEEGDDNDGNAPDEEARYGEETDMGRSQPTSTRQLRLREDTAKYLLNLDPESARYDPKTRSMDMSTQSLANASDSVAEEGFVRPADDASEFERAQHYAWETQEKANPGQAKLHLQANPTEGEVLRKKQTASAAEKKAATQKALLDKYGGAEHLATTPLKQTQVLENERYVEYDASGHIKGEVRSVSKSKYAEDVRANNHGSVWGSWWHDFAWGYACCHSTVKNSYCTGDAGRVAFEDAEGHRTGAALLIKPSQVVENENGDAPETALQNKKQLPTAKKRTLQEIQSGVTEEEMESYKRNRATDSDPMARLLGKDELLT